MTAEETLLKHMDDDRSRDSIIKAMKEYARLQIERDREAIIQSFGDAEWNEKAINRIYDTPITLT